MNERQILTTAALRFDGYRYADAAGLQPAQIIDAHRSGKPQTLNDKLATFFFVQRSACHQPGTTEENEREFGELRELFLELAAVEIPSEYANAKYVRDWQGIDTAATVERIKQIHERTEYVL